MTVTGWLLRPQRIGIAYEITVFESKKLGQTFIVVHGIVIGNDAFPIHRSLEHVRPYDSVGKISILTS